MGVGGWEIQRLLGPLASFMAGMRKKCNVWECVRPSSVRKKKKREINFFVSRKKEALFLLDGLNDDLC